MLEEIKKQAEEIERKRKLQWEDRVSRINNAMNRMANTVIKK
jgi:hypothetical protein